MILPKHIFAVSHGPLETLVVVEGDLVYGNRQELKQKILDEIERGKRRFVIDVAKCGYIDSSGLGVLVSLNKRIQDAGGERLAIRNLCEDLKVLLQLTKVDRLLTVLP